MSGPDEHLVTHTRTVRAPAQRLYGLVAAVEHWPAVFEPTVHVEVLERGNGSERFRIWARVGDAVRTWTSRRVLDPDGLRIAFRQEHSEPPVRSMGGAWEFRADGPRTEIVLTHRFAAVDDAALGPLRTALDVNSERELSALARLAERAHPAEDLVFTFEDVVETDAVQDAYDFVDRADLWPERLPHVDAVTLTEEAPGVQDLSLATVTADGSVHRTRSTRLCFPSRLIAYKQVVPPALLTGHAGAWLFDADAGTVTARHTVAIDPDRIGADRIGAGTSLAEARRRLRDALGANSRATLAHAAAARAGS